ncbi:hypothetical protein UFOVP760_168 [uncultured Caudovirales phage]|uniref:Uncharacterized protein n=1 Tax=uncultured Caudovirales phage TaxID=2100421 RepID=A0A6J7X6Y6_9CAUD|nr:hypothetical protein UFOVP760_168 [uncultured Caudovirales phage]
MDTFNDNLSPDELKYLTLQFMGQNMGELKELDKNLITKTNTLNGMVLDPHAVLNSIAPPVPPQQIQHTPVVQHSSVVQHPQLTPIVAQSLSVPAITQEKDQNQLEFDFNNNPYTVQVFERIESIEKKIETILKLQADIMSILNSKKEGS